MGTVKNLAIIQARMGSSRLPNKVLMELQGKTVLEHVVERTNRSQCVDEVIVATTGEYADDAIVSLCESKGIRVFRGSENDVLDRYYQCALIIQPVNIVRITADCPMMDPKVIDLVIEEHTIKGNDYTSNTFEPSFPDGEDVEVMTYETLLAAWENAQMASQREHVTQYIINDNQFKKSNVPCSENLEELRWTLDTLNDYHFISKVFERLYEDNPYFGIEAVLDLLKHEPALMQLNRGSQRNEGLQKSLQNDYLVK